MLSRFIETRLSLELFILIPVTEPERPKNYIHDTLSQKRNLPENRKVYAKKDVYI
jgi:hypothetical protein